MCLLPNKNKTATKVRFTAKLAVVDMKTLMSEEATKVPKGVKITVKAKKVEVTGTMCHLRET